MSNFDPAIFLDATTTDAATRRPPLPPGDYKAVIGDVAVKSGQQKEDPSKTWVSLNVPLSIDLTGTPAKDSVGQEKVVVFDSPFLDTNDTGLDWAPGRNRRLGAYREATGLNTPGQPFAPRMLIGRAVLVKIKIEMYNNEPQERVAGVAKIG